MPITININIRIRDDDLACPKPSVGYCCRLANTIDEP